MDRVTLETGQNPVLKFERINGNLRLKGWDQPTLRIDSEHEDTLSVNQSDDQIVVNCKSGCIARVPMDSRLEIGRVDGELMVKSVEGDLIANEVYNNLYTKSVGPVKITKVANNVNCRSIEGDFQCETINGNTTLQEIDGKIAIDQVKGNLVIKGFSAGIAVNANGNATLRLETDPLGSYSIKASGNINCKLASDSSAEIQITSGSRLITAHTEDGTEMIRDSNHTLYFGDAEAKIVLDAAGNVDFSIQSEAEADWTYEFEIEHDLTSMANDISQIVTDQLETQLGSLNKNLSHLSDNLSSVSPRVTNKIEAKRRKLEQKIAKAERRASKQGQHAARKVQRSFGTRKPSVDPVSDEERQKVLEMLQNKLISVQEAEMLLATLEGRKPDLPDTDSDS